MQTESGSSAALISLGGLVNRDGRGRTSGRLNGSITSTTPLQVAGENQKRISAFIVNTGAQDIIVFFGSDITCAAAYLFPRGSVQIDALNPWTGIISVALAAAGAATFDGGEIALP